jgi:IS5 family transposase
VLKSQLVVDKISQQIICTHVVTQGSVHDKKLLEISKVRLKKETKASVDSGYQGLQKHHKNTDIPLKNTKLYPLTKEQKHANKEQSSQRVFVENVIGILKRFRILAEKYRCRRKRFGLRLNLIAGLYNWHIQN